MNAWIIERRSKPDKGIWRICLHLGDRRSKWITFRGTRKEADAKVRGLRTDADRGEFIEPTRRTVASWLTDWLANHVEPKLSARTYETYRNAINKHIVPSALGAIRLQHVRATDVEAYHRAKSSLSATTRGVHHAILSSALKLAVRDGLVRVNVAAQVTERPRDPHSEDVPNVWTAEDASAVLVAAKASSVQTGAFFAVALDAGARKGELQGLRWTDVDLTSGSLRIERQFLEGVGKPGTLTFGPTKTRKVRTVDLAAQTLGLLREHKREQAALKLANRLQYADHGLIFTQNWEHRRYHGSLGTPLSSGLILRMLERLIKEVSARRITVHGLRHTSATLLLAAGVQPHVVQQRLGHSNIRTTLNQYAHVLPSQQADAASRLAGLLYR